LQLTDGGVNEAGSVFWNKLISVQAFTTTFTFQLSEAKANGFTFTIQNVKPTRSAVIPQGSGIRESPRALLSNSTSITTTMKEVTRPLLHQWQAPVTPTIT